MPCYYSLKTVIDADPDLPPAEAVMMADPAPTPVTIPDELTVATVGAELDHVGEVFTTLPCPFSTVADSWVVAPTSTVAELGETDTVLMASSGSGPRSGPTPLSPPPQAARPRGRDRKRILRTTSHTSSFAAGGMRLGDRLGVITSSGNHDPNAKLHDLPSQPSRESASPVPVDYSTITRFTVSLQNGTSHSPA